MTKSDLIDYYLNYYSKPISPYTVHSPQKQIGQTVNQFIEITDEMVARGMIVKWHDEFKLTEKGYEILEIGGYESYLLAKTVRPNTTPSPNTQIVNDEKMSNSDKLNILLFVLGVIVTIVIAILSDKIKI